MYRIIFLAGALHEIESARNWYGQQQPGVEEKFTENIFAAIEKLQSDKIIYGSIYRGLSRVFVKRFPYIVYFRKNTEHNVIIIFGVLHIKQSRSRLDKRV
jgi:plasmid stabilization system protein ParE